MKFKLTLWKIIIYKYFLLAYDFAAKVGLCNGVGIELQVSLYNTMKENAYIDITLLLHPGDFSKLKDKKLKSFDLVAL